MLLLTSKHELSIFKKKNLQKFSIVLALKIKTAILKYTIYSESSALISKTRIQTHI